jgi:phenylalanyl-tRNA synthetase beta chain
VQIGLWVGALQVGLVGELHPDHLRERELESLEVAYAELFVDTLPPLGELELLELARFPATARDLSLDLATGIAASLVVGALDDAHAELSASAGQEDPVRLSSSIDPRAAIELREDYRGNGVEPGRRALLLRLHYRARRRSVTDAEVQPLHDAIVARACDRLRALDPDIRVR